MSAYLLQLLGMGRALVDACDAALLALTGGGTRRFRRGLGLVFALSSATVAATLAALLRRRYLLTVPHHHSHLFFQFLHFNHCFPLNCN
jgi:tRNA A37 threonylcarbamoyltransferase TsaD